MPEENVLPPQSAEEPAVAGQAEPEDDDSRSFISEWVITILLLLFGTTTLVQAFVIPTGSMEDTLLIGDHLLVDKLAYAPGGPLGRYLLPYVPVRRGDIIVFRYPADTRQMFVKRVIGLPGDRIRIVDKQLYLNGQKMEEPYKYHKTGYIDSYRDNFPSHPTTSVDERALAMLETNVQSGELVVPRESYFAMGDNRDSSLDSRYWGFVPRSHIVGKPLLIYWSYDAPTERLVTSGISLAHVVDLSRNFFRKTRWNRSFQLIRGYDLRNQE